MLNKVRKSRKVRKQTQTQNTDTPRATVRTQDGRGTIELDASVQPKPRYTPEATKPGKRQTDDAEIRAAFFEFVDEEGFVDVLDWMAEYAESRRAEVPKSDQPMRAYWRKLQLFAKECADRADNQEVR